MFLSQTPAKKRALSPVVSHAGAALSGVLALTGCSGYLQHDITMERIESAVCAPPPLSDLNGECTPLQENLPGEMPTSGSADYAGAMKLYHKPEGVRDTNYRLAGEVNLTADFSDAGGTMTGTASNFYSEADQDTLIDGELVFSNMVMDRTGSATLSAAQLAALSDAPSYFVQERDVVGEVAGTLQTVGGPLAVDMVYVGSTYGSDAEYILGNAQGSATLNGVATGEVSGSVNVALD